MVIVVFASTSGMMFGSVCLTIWCRLLAPRARARSMYGRAFTDSTCARRIRAVPGHDVMPSTRIVLSTPRPSSTLSTMTSGRNGITSIQSSNRIAIVSTQPP
jgi:hypothetical protein